MLDFGFYNMDCMQGMKEFPDNYFDLAIVDPPYGAGFTEGGGCQGWFSKYHQNPENNGNIGSGGVQQIRQSGKQIREIQKISRGGWHGKDKYYLGREELGRANTQKNHSVGCCPR